MFGGNLHGRQYAYTACMTQAESCCTISSLGLLQLSDIRFEDTHV